jgi:hypothetical protein
MIKTCVLPVVFLAASMVPLLGQSPADVGDEKPARSGNPAIRPDALPRDEHGFLKSTVWDIIQKEAAAKPSSNEAMVLNGRPIYKAYYAKYAQWTPPPPLPVTAGHLRNLSEPPKVPRFAITGKVWPAREGDASVCLWEDDKLAAMSLGVDDNCAPDLPYWKELSKKYGGLNITWNLITCNINGEVDKARMGIAGKWETWQGMVNDGYHLASHSMTHNHNPVPEDGWPGPDWEAAESAHLLDSHLTGQRTRVFAYPGSGVHAFGIVGATLPTSPWRLAVTKYYVAARGGGGDAFNQANLIDYFNIHSTTGSVPALWDDSNPKLADQKLKNLFDPKHKYYRGWANLFIHFINGGKDFDTKPFTVAYGKALEFYNNNRADLWTGFFDDVALYGQERDTAALRTDSVSNGKILFTLTSKMEPSIFDYPLTVKVRLRAAATNAAATQNNKPLPVQVVTHEGGAYALVKVVPDRGQVTLTSN